ncbi:hypothetical protein FKM82_028040 [Ascaphus truei]
MSLPEIDSTHLHAESTGKSLYGTQYTTGIAFPIGNCYFSMVCSTLVHFKLYHLSLTCFKILQIICESLFYCENGLRNKTIKVYSTRFGGYY